jgi:hypothetical protein
MFLLFFLPTPWILCYVFNQMNILFRHLSLEPSLVGLFSLFCLPIPPCMVERSLWFLLNQLLKVFHHLSLVLKVKAVN